MKIVVVSPHRGDAAFSLALAVDGWLAADHRVVVLNCFTKSEAAPYSDVASLHPHDRMSFASAVRRREDLAWNKLTGGRLQWQDLDLLDAPVRLACSLEEAYRVEIRAGDRALARVEGAIAKMARGVPAGEVAFAVPLGVGGHIDHRLAREAALDALPESSIPVAFYENLPAATQEADAEALPRRAEELGRGLGPTFTPRRETEPAVAESRKRNILQCYDSQVDSDQVRSMAAFCRRYGGQERLWGNAAWRACGLAEGREDAA